MATRYRWSITVLTLPERKKYLEKLLRSLNETPIDGPAQLVVVYNSRTRGTEHLMEARIRKLVPSLDVSVYFNTQDTSIVGGRNFQLNLCKGDLICFIDDDVTLHGRVFPGLEELLGQRPMGIVGVRSYANDTRSRFKPRSSTPSVTVDGIRYMPVQGLLAAGYRELFDDVGGFNPRRQYWGEWTELNLRMWRNGFPTGYRMSGGYLRHWLDAPKSPTRNLEGRAAYVLWGLICMAIEYDAVDATEATETFWQLVEERYLSYSFGQDLTPKILLRTTLELMPQLSVEWAAMARFKEAAAEHPFPFKPFQPLSETDVRRVLRHAEKAIRPYRRHATSTTRPGRKG
jgi:glycosyltransferase involved in cell wall biosynthesis